IYTVGRATRGYAKYLKSLSDAPSMAIAYDSRHKSDVFARETARIMADMGVHVYIWPELMPTPALSFANRVL
ncbi:MAG: phospho-sugar mutase, partial [Clostridia bacterium]|nr:phospho-sugar mutase [Clostridia bacterium]